MSINIDFNTFYEGSHVPLPHQYFGWVCPNCHNSVTIGNRFCEICRTVLDWRDVIDRQQPREREDPDAEIY